MTHGTDVGAQAISPGFRYRQRHARRAAIVAGLALALCLSIAVDVATGPSGMGLERLLRILLNPGSMPRVERRPSAPRSRSCLGLAYPACRRST
jgi:iron complex transport system permease protein